MNVVSLVGRLTREVELRYTNNGTAVGRFTLAVNRRFPNQNGEREADFITCVIWSKAAENFANFTRKGSQVGVQGRIQTGSYDNQQGQRVYTTEVIVENFDLLESREVTEQRPKSSGNQGSYSSNHTSQQPADNGMPSFGQTPTNGQFDISDDDLPF